MKKLLLFLFFVATVAVFVSATITATANKKDLPPMEVRIAPDKVDVYLERITLRHETLAYQASVRKACAKYTNIDRSFVVGVLKSECWSTKIKALYTRAESRCKAEGPMQLTYYYTREGGPNGRRIIDPYSIFESIETGTKILSWYMVKYEGDIDKVLSAYNAGPGRTDRAIRKGGVNWKKYIPRETRDYIINVKLTMHEINNLSLEGIDNA